MKTMIEAGRPFRAKALAIVIMVALVAVVAGCGDPVTMYNLTIDSTAGGVVTVPGEGTFTNPAGAVVNLVAKPDTGYYLVNWSGDVQKIDNTNIITTTIHILDNYHITANFAEYIAGTSTTARIAAGKYHTVGLKWDDTAVAVGKTTTGQCNVTDWTDIMQVAAGNEHTVGLKSDGTVVAVGANWAGQDKVDAWTDIVQLAAGHYHTVGLKSDGNVVAAGIGAELYKWNLGGATT